MFHGGIFDGATRDLADAATGYRVVQLQDLTKPGGPFLVTTYRPAGVLDQHGRHVFRPDGPAVPDPAGG